MFCLLVASFSFSFPYEEADKWSSGAEGCKMQWRTADCCISLQLCALLSTAYWLLLLLLLLTCVYILVKDLCLLCNMVYNGSLQTHNVSLGQ